MPLKMVIITPDIYLRVQQEREFTHEINIHTNIFLNTIDYLDPVVPAPIYGNILNKETVIL